MRQGSGHADAPGATRSVGSKIKCFSCVHGVSCVRYDERSMECLENSHRGFSMSLSAYAQRVNIAGVRNSVLASIDAGSNSVEERKYATQVTLELRKRSRDVVENTGSGAENKPKTKWQRCDGGGIVWVDGGGLRWVVGDWLWKSGGLMWVGAGRDTKKAGRVGLNQPGRRPQPSINFPSRQAAIGLPPKT